jgi:hypothetical protein
MSRAASAREGEMSEITPALTPEEWATYKGYGDLRGPLETAAGCLKGGELTQHGLAAICLHGQPFGFTQHDVWVARTLADHVDTMHPGGIQLRRDALALAERIAALLPPETG